MASDVAALTRASTFAPFVDERTVLLTTFRHDGRPVNTPVHIAVDGSTAFVRTFEPSGKLTRIRRNPAVEIAPCTIRGRVTGPSMHATAHVLDGEESEVAGRAIAQKYPLIHGRLIPWLHRRKGLVTTHIELTAR